MCKWSFGTEKKNKTSTQNLDISAWRYVITLLKEVELIAAMSYVRPTFMYSVNEPRPIGSRHFLRFVLILGSTHLGSSPIVIGKVCSKARTVVGFPGTLLSFLHHNAAHRRISKVFFGTV